MSSHTAFAGFRSKHTSCWTGSQQCVVSFLHCAGIGLGPRYACTHRSRHLKPWALYVSTGLKLRDYGGHDTWCCELLLNQIEEGISFSWRMMSGSKGVEPWTFLWLLTTGHNTRCREVMKWSAGFLFRTWRWGGGMWGHDNWCREELLWSLRLL